MKKQKEILEEVFKFILNTTPDDQSIEIENITDRIKVIYSNTINSSKINS